MLTTWPRTRRKWRDLGSQSFIRSSPLSLSSSSSSSSSSSKWRKNVGKERRQKSWPSHNHGSIRIIYSVVLAACMATQEVECAKCPSPETIPGCPCYSFEDGLFLECAGATEESLRSALAGVINSAGDSQGNIIVQSLSVYELDRKLEELRTSAFPTGSRIRHLQISHSSLREINEDAFNKLNRSLESLALISARLNQVPQKALSYLSRLKALDLESNQINDLQSYGFYGLSLMKLNLKSNEISKISEYAFADLENTLNELDLAENKIRTFPMTALRRLDRLTSLRLAWNEISQLPEDGYSRLNALIFLDLSSNNFQKIPLNCFRCCPALKTLSLYYNSIDSVDKDAFISLFDLETIDLSHNKIITLQADTFRANQKLRSIDLSNNHVHYIKGVFSKLPELKELFLAENNILEIPANTFIGSFSLSVIYLQQNAIGRIDERSLADLNQLAQLHLSSNYIDKVPREFLQYCENLSTLSLDGNNIKELEVGTFAKTKQLRELRLQDNQITEVKRGVFAPLPSLLELHLQNNALTDMETGALKSLNNLQHVNLQGNLLAVLGDVFQVSNNNNEIGSSSLISIQLDNNGLGVLHNDSLKGQASVRIMWLGHNRLTRLQAPLFRDLLLVERLYLTNNSISRIEDSAFQTMQALKYLELSMNKLSHVTIKMFSELHKLEELYLQDNGLRRLDAYALTALKRLRVLDLGNNRLNVLHDKIFQEGLPIRSLNLKNCSVSTIENGAFRGLNNLYELNLEDNRLTAMALDRLDIPGLRILRISLNNFSLIGSHSLIGLPSLQHLIMESVGLFRIPQDIFTNNKNLLKLSLNGNDLKFLPYLVFFGLESLREVLLDGNKFEEIPYDVFGNATTSMEILSLANNRISYVDVSRFNNGLNNLRELDFHGNFISMVTGFGMTNEIRLPRLVTINLANNHLTVLPSNFFTRSYSLRRIELSGNRFKQLPAGALSVKNIAGLNWLNISGNVIQRIHEINAADDKYPALQEIHICNTNLSVIGSRDLESFPILLHLFMANNLIARISPGAFRYLKNLLTLDLSGNLLELLPEERLRGLDKLKVLNLTKNHLKEIDAFSLDLKDLQVLDLSFNRISSIGINNFEYLNNLVELYVNGNWITRISNDAFKPLKKLKVLDLRRNYLEYLPLNSLVPLETQIRSLRMEGNPLNCSCESEELWKWLRNHRKLIGTGRNRLGSFRSNNVDTSLLRCDKPAELRGLVFLDLDLRTFCTTPLILHVGIQEVQSFSMIVSWQSRNHSELRGYRIIYESMDREDEIRGKLLEAKTRSTKLSQLTANTQYLICVFGLGDWLSNQDEEIRSDRSNSSQDERIDSRQIPQMRDSSTSKCTEVKTLGMSEEVVIGSDGSSSIGEADNDASHFLTRRLGLIVGCCMGFIVFLLLVFVLGYLKVKKQREASKRDQQAIPPEYISYRHFSIQSGEAGHGGAGANAVKAQTSQEAGHHETNYVSNNFNNAV